MAKRKYTRMRETAKAYECTKIKCKWQGMDDEKSRRRINKYQEVYIFPKCGNDEFYGLIDFPTVL
jgi:hypothetical protein